MTTIQSLIDKYSSRSDELTGIPANEILDDLHKLKEVISEMERDAFEAGNTEEVPGTLSYGLKYSSYEDWKQKIHP